MNERLPKWMQIPGFRSYFTSDAEPRLTDLVQEVRDKIRTKARNMAFRSMILTKEQELYKDKATRFTRAYKALDRWLERNEGNER